MSNEEVSAEAHRDNGASRNRQATRSAVQEPPTVYDVVELPEDAPWRSCQRYRQGDHGMEPCGEPAEFVFVYEANIHDDNDRRDNCLACPECCPAVSADIHAEHSARTDGGREESAEAQKNPVELPESHPLASYNGVLDDHESHVEALAQYLEETDAEEIRSLMLILTTEEPATETIPSMKNGEDFENVVWHQLAAHISHVASAFNVAPEKVATHACHVLRDQQGPTDVYGGAPADE